MIKLETKCKNHIDHAVFYFHTLEECNIFKYTFRDHWCNIKWEKPIEISNNTHISEYQRKSMDKDPKKRAEDNLSWGFNRSENSNSGLTREQNNFIQNMINRVSE